ncbi:hypothetical protein [Nocardioides flavescens]|uniref:Uncharacterized protein n=1 Tax=Nocardioides flavescens TaxID=2691959 RepID=A0A6L7EZE1_9ACTN|nr:hypothetical protein [Nocardioides flavescens]MXG89905.1 hypothetical protein [Nocardioides flavescens]
MLENVTTDNTVNGGTLCSLPSGTFASITFRNVTLRRAAAFLNNTGAAITGMLVENVRAMVMSGPALRSTTSETGQVSDARVDLFSAGVQHYTGAASKLRFGGDVPEVIAGDVNPLPTRGSEHVAKSVDLTGGSATTSGKYIGDGTAWNRIVAFANA